MTARAIIIALVLALVSVVWIHQASLVETPGLRFAPVYLSSVPPVPALVFLVLLMAVRGIMRASRRKHRLLRPLQRREMLTVYAFLVIAVPPTTFGIVQLMLPWMTAPTYFSTPQQETAELVAQLPGWYAPDDFEVIRTMYEGTDAGVVPWAAWLRPLTAWTIFLTVLFCTGLCLVTIFRKQWSEHERLRYPLLLIPLDITAEEGTDTRQAVGNFFRDPLVWTAIAIVLLHHCLNVANAYNPAITALKDRFSMAGLFTEHPWTSFRRLSFFHRPQMIGFGYFVSLDVLFSVWFFHLMDPLLQSFAHIFGYRATPGWPFIQQQGTGAFLMLMLVLGWTGRAHLAEMLRAAVGRGNADHSDEPMSPRVAVFGALAGFIVMIAWISTTGMSVLTACAYLGMLLVFGLVYSRIRAETGVATMWAYPFDQARNTMHYVLGGEGLTRGGPGNLLGVTAFSWIGRGYFMSMMGYQIENEKLAEEAKLSRRGMPWLIIAAFLVGMAAGYVVNLRSYYDVGANVMQGGTTGGGYNVQTATREWTQAVSALENPAMPDMPRVKAIGGGALFTLLLVITRFSLIRSPLHPLGYAMSLNYGYALWGPFFAAWLLKSLIHRIGGARAYRRAMPFFLGLAFGDLFIGGISWVLMALFGAEIFNGYMVQFG